MIQIPLSQSGPPDQFAAAVQQIPDQSVLRRLLRYEPDTGKLYWLQRESEWFSDGFHSAETSAKQWNAKWAGKEAFTTTMNGYKHGSILNEKYWANRVIFKLMTGTDPIEVDHIDGDHANNKWENLRDADRSINMRNAFRRKDNTSGVTGVSWHKDKRKWRSRIMTDGKYVYLGVFACFGAAVKARKMAQVEYEYSPRHGTSQ